MLSLYDSNNINYYLYKCIILSIRKKNPKYINNALKKKYFYNENLLSNAYDVINYLIEKDLYKLSI